MDVRAPVTLLVAFGSLSCLPGETRAVRGPLLVRAEAPEPYGESEARMSSDGWSVHIRQLYVTLGGVELEGDSCDAYAEARYSRVLDMTRSGPQKVSLNHALGDCRLAFAAAGPRWNTLPGEGVPPGLVEQFRTAEDDDEANGVSISLAGEASRDGARIRFEWPFRVQLSYRDCRPDGASARTSLLLVSGEEQGLDISVDAFALFRTELDAPELRFTPFAEADHDADGDLSLAEVGLAGLLDGPLGSRLQYLLAPKNGSCATFELCERACDRSWQ